MVWGWSHRYSGRVKSWGGVTGQWAWSEWSHGITCPQDADADPALSDWDKYAAEEYDFLVAEEAADTWDGG